MKTSNYPFQPMKPPFPVRFRTAEDGRKFLASVSEGKTDWSLTVPSHITKNNGSEIIPNPEYRSAPFEQGFLTREKALHEKST